MQIDWRPGDGPDGGRLASPRNVAVTCGGRVARWSRQQPKLTTADESTNSAGRS
jgi:hypothetical protein